MTEYVIGEWYQGEGSDSYGKLTGEIKGVDFPSVEYITRLGVYITNGSYFNGANWTQRARKVPLSEIARFLPKDHPDLIKYQKSLKQEQKYNTKEEMDITKVLEGVYSNLELRRTIIPLFLGDPGTGKSVTVHQFAKDKGVTLVKYIASQMSPFEVSGVTLPDRETKQMVCYDFDKLNNLKDGDILFVDELLNANPTVLAAFLTVLEDRMTISGKKLPDVMIVAAANPQGMVPLTPQIKERFVWYDYKFNEAGYKAELIKKYKVTKTIASKLASLVKEEKFEKNNNFNSGRSIDKAVSMIINDVPTPYSDIILPILSELLDNPKGRDYDLGGGRIWKVDEKIKWIDLKRHGETIKK